MIPALRDEFNRSFVEENYASLLAWLEQRCGSRVEFRVAETPIFVPSKLLDGMAAEGAALTRFLMANEQYLAAARNAIPRGYCVAGETAHPNFLTADFALVREDAGELVPKLVEIQAFPSVYAYQAILSTGYREVFSLDPELKTFLGGLDEERYWSLLRETVLGNHAPENVVLTEVDPLHQKTLPDFAVTAEKLGIAVVDIATLEAKGNQLWYRDKNGRLTQVRRIYNRAIADELIARNIRLPFDLTYGWDVEWAGHPNWYFLISKFSIPWLSSPPGSHPVVPPAAFLSDFLAGKGRQALADSGVELPHGVRPDTIFKELLLKPLFSFAGKGIQFDPTLSDLESIPEERRRDYLLQQKMRFEPTIVTPFGLSQAEIRILYLWPDHGSLTPALSLVRLGRGKMMGVDHNKNQRWVGASAAFHL